MGCAHQFEKRYSTCGNDAFCCEALLGAYTPSVPHFLTAEDEPIPGLFAIGNVQGDFFGKDYPVHCPGVSHGRCVTFGQLVGEACAKDTTIGELDFA